MDRPRKWREIKEHTAAMGPQELRPGSDLGALRHRWGHRSQDRGGEENLFEATLVCWAEVSFKRVQGISLDPCPPCALGLLSLSTALQTPGLCAERV